MTSSDKLSLGIAVVAAVSLVLVLSMLVWGEVKKQEIKSANCIGEASYQVPLVTYHQL